MTARTLTILALIAAAICIASSCLHKDKNAQHTETLPDIVSYNFNIRPILSDKCFKCHGPDPSHREAGLRLDIADSAYAPLKNSKGAFAIVPGKPGRSELIKRVTSTDLTYMMPPPDAHLGMLSDYEKKLFTKWIEQGARYQRHWAFTPPVAKPLPEVKDKTWPKNDID
jgi:hypothetical protein